MKRRPPHPLALARAHLVAEGVPPAEALRLALTLSAARAAGHDQPTVADARRWFGDQTFPSVDPERALDVPALDADDLGPVFEDLRGGGREDAGRWFTPRTIAERLVRGALSRWRGDPPTVLDPACGAGVFLVAALRALVEIVGSPNDALARLRGVDLDPEAAHAARLSLWLASGAREPPPAALSAVTVGDALDLDLDPADLVLGNPPWVAYAGRASRPITPARREVLRARYEGFGGYPTLHGAFADRATALLTPGGVVALLLPSAMADLDGYAPMRRAVSARVALAEPMEEFGPDVFDGVVQPCFAMVGTRRGAPPDPRPWTLRERRRAGVEAVVVEPPRCLARLGSLPRFAPATFGDVGVQTSPAVRALIADAPSERHTVPLREGKDVTAYRVGPARRWLDPDPAALRAARARMRPPEAWRAVAFVVRQTAAFPIAALHRDPSPFRNSLLAGYAVDGVDPALAVACLNSAPLRALHLASRRDGRQAAFPQVKVAHLRALPAPPEGPLREAVTEMVRSLTIDGPTPEGVAAVEARVCALYGITTEEREALERFIADRARPVT